MMTDFSKLSTEAKIAWSVELYNFVGTPPESRKSFVQQVIESFGLCSWQCPPADPVPKIKHEIVYKAILKYGFATRKPTRSESSFMNFLISYWQPSDEG